MQKKLKDVAEIKFCLANPSTNQNFGETKLITPANLLENNIISHTTLTDKYKIDNDAKITSEDIIIKRISPSFINYIDLVGSEICAGSNLILVRAKSIDAKYLAYLLNKKIKRITKSCVGATIPAIGRSDLENVSIPILPLDQQKAIGEIWYSNTKLQKLRERLAELENIKIRYYLDQYTTSKIGGKKNG